MPRNHQPKLLLVFMFIMMACSWKLTQAQKSKFEFFTTAEGLAGNNTSSVVQDHSGFIWFVNEGKLHRNDGRSFEVFTPSRNDVSIDEAFLGVANYQDSALFVWGEKTAFLFEPYAGKWKQIIVDTSILSAEETFYWHRMGSDHILLNRGRRGKNDASLVLFEDGKFTALQLPKQLCPFKNTLVDNRTYFLNYWCDIDKNGIVNLAYRDTLYQFDKDGEIVRKIPIAPICTNCYNVCFQFSDDDDILLSTNWNFYKLNENKDGFVPHPANKFLKTGITHLHRFILEKNGSFWACGANRNLVYYDAVRDTVYNYHKELISFLQSANDFKGVFKDRSGVVWIDTRLGLLKVIPQPYPFQTYLTGKTERNAFYSFRGFTENEKGEIFGVFYDGIARINPRENRVDRVYNFDHFISIFDLYAENNVVWVNGGQFLEEKTGQLTSVSSPLFDNPVGDNGFFAKERGGKLWWFAHYTLYYLDASSPQYKWVKELELKGKVYNRSEALHYGDKSGLLWLNYLTDIIAYSPQTKEQKTYSIQDFDLPISRITAIQEAKNGELWIGTDVGLAHIDLNSKQSKLYTTADGLPNNFLCGIQPEGDSALWISTNHGLSRFNIKKQSFLNFFEDDGLSHNEFNRKSFFTASNGKMYFGGMRGVNAFFPRQVMQTYRNKSRSANLVLSSFEFADERFDSLITRKTFGAIPELNLYHWNWSYNFEYALTDYSNPDEIFYSYKMDGYKESWSTPSKLNSARFNSLPNGEYVFRVRARDSRGRWHPNELAVAIVVHPPWWLTKTAYLIYVLSFLFWLRVFSKFRERRLIARQKQLEQTVSDRTAELLSEKQEVERQRQRSDELLLNILPEGVAEELKLTGRAEAKLYEEASVMFTDFADFTTFAETLSAGELVSEIDACFQAFDEIIGRYKLEKIKTIGDAYMCAGGLNLHGLGRPTAVVLAGLEMQEFMCQRKATLSKQGKPSFVMRVGIHTGPVVAGVVGVKKFQYDIWGDAVNTAARMESTSQCGKVNISQETYKYIQDDLQFSFESRGAIQVKGKGELKMWFVSKA